MTKILKKQKQPFDHAQGKANTPLSPKVFVGLSGGVDSSVAALMLKEQGYEVTGVYMKNWSEPEDLTSGACTWIEDRRDAIAVASALDIPFLTFDFEKEYRKFVIEYLFSEYQAGRTPNPDIMCNKFIKFDLFLKKSLSLGADFIATGHYAKKLFAKKEKKFTLNIPKDTHKDQTYFLYLLGQKELGKILFPLESLNKMEVRKIARKHHLITAEKKDSQGICFVGEVPIEQFLKKRLPEKHGKVFDTRGHEIGTHRGAYFFTIGQRHGFQIFNQKTNAKPHYVVKKDVKKNTLVVAEGKQAPELSSKIIEISNVHWISGKPPKPPFSCMVRIRHGQSLQRVLVKKNSRGRIQILFSKPQRGVAAGQSAVLYHRGVVLGGGIIK